MLDLDWAGLIIAAFLVHSKNQVSQPIQWSLMQEAVPYLRRCYLQSGTEGYFCQPLDRKQKGTNHTNAKWEFNPPHHFLTASGATDGPQQSHWEASRPKQTTLEYLFKKGHSCLHLLCPTTRRRRRGGETTGLEGKLTQHWEGGGTIRDCGLSSMQGIWTLRQWWEHRINNN